MEIIGIILFAIIGAYLYGENRTLRKHVAKVSEVLDAANEERRDALSQLLLKHGSKPLGYVPPPPKSQEPINRVVTRGEAQKRTVEKAREILENRPGAP